MNGRSAGPRSFNTLQRSHREERLRRLQEARILLLAICALILLLALTGLVFLFCHIGHNVSSGGTSGGSGKVVYTKVTLSASDMYVGDLILVNSEHSYHFPSTDIEDMADRTSYDMRTYLASGGSEAYSVKERSGMLETACMMPNAAQALDGLLRAFYASTDVPLAVYECYRSYDYQATLNTSVKAGYSDQHTALSAWITDSTGSRDLSADSKNRLVSLGASYGFIQRYPSGKSAETGVSNYTELFRYVGVPHAAYMTSQNLSLERYLNLLRDEHTYSGTHLLLNANGNAVTKDATYEIYYVPSTGESTTVSVPRNYKYTISGDNVGGFIVTVDLSSPVG